MPVFRSLFSCIRLGSIFRNSGRRSGFRFLILLNALTTLPVMATVTAVSVQSPNVSKTGTTHVSSPVHLAATAESDLQITGYVVYVDGQNVFRNFSPSLDAWVAIPAGAVHSLYIKAWDKSGSALATSTYSIKATALAPPTPAATANRIENIDNMTDWVVDNNNDVGGQCNDGSMGTFDNQSDPNTSNSPAHDGEGQHFVLMSKCQYDDSLFLWKNPGGAQPSSTNFLWDFWFYIPSSTQNHTVQATEFDLFQAVTLSDGVHWFMFGSQCNYATNQWQIWLPKGNGLSWVNAGFSNCQFATGVWHHATYFLQRVTPSGYQVIPADFNSNNDTNSDLRFVTLSIDGNTMFLNGLSYSTKKSNWSPTLGVQHQLDSSVSGVTIEEYTDQESLTTW